MVATRDELTADRVALVNARTSLLTGQTVREVWRDGRRLIFAAVTVANITAAIADVDDQLRALDVTETGSRPRYHALSVRFQG
jgi:hypothetical protein